MKKPVTIRTMHMSDFFPLYELWKQVGLTLAPVKREQHEFSMMLALNPDTCLLAWCDGQIVGSILAVFNGRRAWMYHLAIRANWQGRGLGSRLLLLAEKKLKKKGVTKALLWVDTSNNSVGKFYKKRGYRLDDGYMLFGKDLVK